jgi:hypothetical protein
MSICAIVVEKCDFQTERSLTQEEKRMRKLSVKLVIIGLLALVAAGCAMSASPVTGFIYTDVQGPSAATSNSGSSKVGTASCQSILGWVATGDASIETAAKSAGITKIHHVDFYSQSILGVWAKFTVKVYGE